MALSRKKLLPIKWEGCVMRTRTTVSWLLLLPLVTLSAEMSFACGEVGIPDLSQSLVTWGLGAGESATLLVLPDGSGAPLTAALRPGGLLVDATIHLTLIDGCGDPICCFPREDMWLESQDRGLVVCAGGSIADRNTGPDGQTEWTLPLKAGGHSQADCQVVVNAWILSGSVPLHFNSPDLNGDRAVSLIDVASFARAHFGPYSFAADLRVDGVLNLSDIAVMARGAGTDCP